MAYVELHGRSSFSFLEGASLPEALASVCAVQDIPAMALLDRNGLYGAPRFHMAAQKTGIKAHVGAEISLAETDGLNGSLPLLCESRRGYQNLYQLITKMKLRVPKHAPVMASALDLEEHTDGLICLTGDEHGPLAHGTEAMART
jgi:error-prone DNA polymerase